MKSIWPLWKVNASEIHSILLNVLLTSVQSRLGRAASRALRFKQVLLQVAESQECFVKLAIIGCVLRTTSCYTSPQLVECVAQIKALLIYNYLVAIVTVPRWQIIPLPSWISARFFLEKHKESNLIDSPVVTHLKICNSLGTEEETQFILVYCTESLHLLLRNLLLMEVAIDA